MTDVWEIAQYVEGHPDNYPQRWRLAKKLYLAWEYRLALEHLQILKNEWEEKENVRRYLAATYFRLKRYTDAVNELEEAIGIWPEQLGFREQLARVLDESGDEKGALEVWKKILEIDPEHASAARKIKKAGKKKDGREKKTEPPEEPPETESVDEALAARPEDLDALEGERGESVADTVCPRCGTRNNSENGRCWRCQSPLEAELEPVSRPLVTYTPNADENEAAPEVVWPVAIGVALFLLFAFDVYLTFAKLPLTESSSSGAGLPITAFGYLSERLVETRILSGFLLLAAWPLLMHFAAYLVGARGARPNGLTAIGVLAATTTYAAFWLPTAGLWLTPFVAAAVSLVPTLFLLGLSRAKAVGLWAIQIVSAAFIPFFVILATYGTEFVLQLPAIVRHESRSAAAPPPKLTGTTPVDFGVVWKSTGSEWLDREAAVAGFVVDTGAFDKRLFLEIKDENERLVLFEEIKSDRFDFTYAPLEIEKPYRIIVSGREDGIDVTITLRSLFGTSRIGTSPSLE